MPISLSQYKKSLIPLNFHIRNKKDIKIIPYHICQDYPVMCLLMNEKQGLIAADFSGVNDGHINDGVTWKKHGMLFDANTGYLNCGSDKSLNITDAITIEAWIKPINSGWNPIVSSHHTSTNPFKGFDFFIWTNDDIFFDLGDGVAYHRLMNTYPNYNIWYYTVATYNGIIQKMYINGIKQANTNIWSGTIDPSALNTFIGKHHINHQYFDGFINSVRIYNYALSPKIIAKHFNKEKHTYGV